MSLRVGSQNGVRFPRSEPQASGEDVALIFPFPRSEPQASGEGS